MELKNAKKSEKKNGKNVVKEAAVDYKAGETAGSQAPDGVIGEETKGSEKAESGKTDAKTGKAKAGKDDGKKGKAKAFEAKPIPKHLQGLVDQIDKLKTTGDLKDLARVIKRKWSRLDEVENLNAAKAFKAGDSVAFKKGSKEKIGKVVKVKPNGKVKIDVSGTTWRVPAKLVSKHSGKVNGKAAEKAGETSEQK